MTANHRPDRFDSVPRTAGYGALRSVADHTAAGRSCPIAAIPRYRAVFNPSASSARQPGARRGVAFRGWPEHCSARGRIIQPEVTGSRAVGRALSPRIVRPSLPRASIDAERTTGIVSRVSLRSEPARGRRVRQQAAPAEPVAAVAGAAADLHSLPQLSRASQAAKPAR